MKTKSSPSITRRTLHYYFLIAKRYKWLMVVNIIAPAIGVVVGDIIFPYYLAVLFERLAHLGSVPTADIWRIFYLLILLTVIEVTFWRINDYTFVRRQAKTLRNMERFLFGRLQLHSYRFFTDNFAGSLTTQFNRFLRSYEQLEDVFMFEILTTFLMLIFAIGVLLFIASPLGIALLIWAVLFIGMISWLTVKKSPLTRAASAADSRVTANIADSITNILNVKIFARRSYESRRFSQTSQERFEKRYRSWLFDAHIRNVRWAFVIIFMFVYLYLSIRLVSSGSVNMATVLAAQLYIMTIYNQLFNLNRTIERIQLYFADAVEMTEILDKTPEIQDPEQPQQLRVNKGGITFASVDFRYEDEAPTVLTNFNLHIAAGQKVGLVGHSGSGKSTLTRLLMRFSDIQQGEILIDGQNIAHVTQDDLRSQLAYVPQEPMLFHRSLIENIRYGRPDASDEAVYEAARRAHAAEFIEKLPHGYDTMVGERGVKLSGGEKQRIAIARAMLSQAPILILDEATSALDSKSEKLITAALHDLMQHRTTIVIAHRLSTIRKLDRILVMKAGNIIEDGSHKLLLAKKGEYAELWSHQSGGFIEE